MIRTESLLAGVLEYGFQYKKIAHRIMHPTEATIPKREYLDFNERPPNDVALFISLQPTKFHLVSFLYNCLMLLSSV
jgi:hypothetical protein